VVGGAVRAVAADGCRRRASDVPVEATPVAVGAALATIRDGSVAGYWRT